MTHLRPTAPLTPSFPSRLPAVGTTIFTVMSTLAAEHQAINLGQGFPDFQCDTALIDAVNQAMVSGHNQYPPMPGALELRKTIASKIDRLYGKSYDPTTEITITAGDCFAYALAHRDTNPTVLQNSETRISHL